MFPNPFKLVVYSCFAFLLVLSSCNKEEMLLPERNGFYATRGNHPGIFDKSNRQVLLRGVNYSVLGDYYQAIDSIPSETDYDPIHIEEMAKIGFNHIRLVLNWSALEPERGNYSVDYINQIKEIVNKAAQHDIGIILDMHQDAWGKYIASPVDVVCPSLLQPSVGWDGAPEWATITDGESTCKLQGGTREMSPAVLRAWQNFYNDRDEILTAFTKAWQFLVSNFAADPNVIGYDIINEPNFGEHPLGYGQDVLLGNLYTKAIEAIRATERQTSGGFEHIIFFEPSVEWSAFTWTFHHNDDFTEDENIVFAPHIYGGSITIVGNTQDGFRNAEIMAKHYETTFWSGEWGYFGDPVALRDKVLNYARYEDEYLVGGAYWQWIQACGDPHNISGDLENIYNLTSNHLWRLECPGDVFIGVMEEFTSVLGRAYPRASPGRILKLESDPDAKTMMMEGEGKGEVDIWVPEKGQQPTITGDIINVSIVMKNGGYRVSGTVDGSYTININY